VPICSWEHLKAVQDGLDCIRNGLQEWVVNAVGENIQCICSCSQTSGYVVQADLGGSHLWGHFWLPKPVAGFLLRSWEISPSCGLGCHSIRTVLHSYHRGIDLSHTSEETLQPRKASTPIREDGWVTLRVSWPSTPEVDHIVRVHPISISNWGGHQYRRQRIGPVCSRHRSHCQWTRITCVLSGTGHTRALIG
jgi:hypothetical protein